MPNWLRRIALGITAEDDRLFTYKCTRRVWSVSATPDTERLTNKLFIPCWTGDGYYRAGRHWNVDPRQEALDA